MSQLTRQEFCDLNPVKSRDWKIHEFSVTSIESMLLIIDLSSSLE
jgi:hypothetical protein